MKKLHGAYMTCKAFNGRLVGDWLLNCAEHAHQGTYPVEGGRTFGAWLQGEIAAGSRVQPTDERLIHQRLALTLECIYIMRS